MVVDGVTVVSGAAGAWEVYMTVEGAGGGVVVVLQYPNTLMIAMNKAKAMPAAHLIELAISIFNSAIACLFSASSLIRRSSLAWWRSALA